MCLEKIQNLITLFLLLKSESDLRSNLRYIYTLFYLDLSFKATGNSKSYVHKA